MKFTRLRLTIEPWRLQASMKELRIEILVDGVEHTVLTPVYDDDFESRFDYVMEQVKREVLSLVKGREKKGQ